MEDNSPQQPRLKATRAGPPQSTPRPSAAAIPTSPPGPPPTGTAGQSSASTTPMETDNDGDETMGGSAAQSISSLTTSSIAENRVIDVENMMWSSILSPQCSPMVLTQLIEAEFTPLTEHSHNEHLKVITQLSNSMPIQRDSFIPTSAMNDTAVSLVLVADNVAIPTVRGDRDSARLQGNTWRQ
eukprot:4189363-Amphidinium_carterae.2